MGWVVSTLFKSYITNFCSNPFFDVLLNSNYFMGKTAHLTIILVNFTKSFLLCSFPH